MGSGCCEGEEQATSGGDGEGEESSADLRLASPVADLGCAAGNRSAETQGFRLALAVKRLAPGEAASDVRGPGLPGDRLAGGLGKLLGRLNAGEVARRRLARLAALLGP